MQKEGSEGGRRGLISHSHIRPCMVIPGKPSARLSRPLRGLTHDLELITGRAQERRTVQGKAIKSILCSTVHRVPWTVYHLRGYPPREALRLDWLIHLFYDSGA